MSVPTSLKRMEVHVQVKSDVWVNVKACFQRLESGRKTAKLVL